MVLWHQISNDVLREILKRSSAKFLIRFMCTSRFWRSEIADPSFFASHLKHSSLRYDSYLLHLTARFPGVSSEQRFCTLLSDDGPFLVERSKIRVPFETVTGSYSIVGSCNGLLCLTDWGSDFGRFLYMWNPSAGIHKTLFDSCMFHRFSDHNIRVVLGFGFDSISNDYKIVRVMQQLVENTLILKDTPPQVEVYSLTSDSWSFFGSIAQTLVEQKSNAFLHGALHWLASDLAMGNFNSIVSFNVAREEFKVMVLPNIIVESNGIPRHDTSLKVLHESLAIVVIRDVDVGLRNLIDVWEMVLYGVAEAWNLTSIVVSLERVIHGTLTDPERKIHGSLGFTKRGKALFGNMGGNLLVCNPIMKETLNIGLCEDLVAVLSVPFMDSIPFSVVPYMDSLILLDLKTTMRGQMNPIGGVTYRGTEVILVEEED